MKRIQCAVVESVIALSFVMTMLVAASCGDDGRSTSSPSVTPIENVDPMLRVEKARAGACANDVAIEPSSASHQEIVNAVAVAKQRGLGAKLGALVELPALSTSLAQMQVALAVEAPDKPEKPSYEKPAYEGTWRISGSCRGTFEERGVVVQARGKYFVILDAEPCETAYVNGYVESTEETVTLNLGRDGREATVVKLMDRETYVDDQSVYREEVADAKAQHALDVREYPHRVREWERDIAAAKELAVTNRRTLDSLVTRWRTVLNCDRVAGTPSNTLQAPLAGAASTRRPGVDADCYEAGTICSKVRLSDAEAVAELIRSPLAKAGVPAGCFELQYIDGEGGGRDAISVGITSNEGSCGTATRAKLERIASTVKNLVAGKRFSENVDLVQVTDGNDLDVRVALERAHGAPAAPPEDDESGPAAPSPADDTATANSAGCDAVDCALTKYKAACCEAFRPAATEPVQTPNPKRETVPAEDERPAVPAGLDRTAIAAGIGPVKPRIMECGRSANVTGTVKVSIKVSPDGTIKGISVKETPDADLALCVVEAIQPATFAPSVNGASFSYPFVF